MSARYFHIATLGCKINQYESQSIREAWTRRGYLEAPEAEDAQIIIVNSCAVTAKAVADLRRTAHRLLRARPDAQLVITGCAAQVMADELAELFEGARIIPQDRKAELLAPAPLDAPDPQDVLTQAPQAEQPATDFSVSGYSRARAVIKVQDGCSHHCTYCIVPLTRGKSVSRDPREVLAEVRRVFDAGWREATLSGVNLRHYGRGLDDMDDFWDLLNLLEAELAPQWAGRARLRLSSLDPGQLGPKALDAIGGSRMLCPQLHLSLQSLAPDVLRRMGRGHYGPELVLDWVQELQSVWPVFGLGADLLTGFPGETEQDFLLTLENCKKLPLSYAHVFPYSIRPDTPAADYPGQLPPEVKKRRAKALRDLAGANKVAFARQLATLPELSVVLQAVEPARGVSEFYASCRFEQEPRGAEVRQLVRATPLRAEDGVVIVRANE